MSKIVTATEIDIQLKGTENIKSLTSEIRKAKEEAAQMARTFGEFSTEAVNAVDKVAQLKDEQSDLNTRIKAMNPDKFTAIANAASGIAGGIAVAQGAMGLFGAESEDAEKAMLKVQSAMALSQGLQGLGDAKQGIMTLARSAGTTLVNAFTSVAGAARAIGAALGIGLILIAVTALIANWDRLKVAIGLGATEQERMRDATLASRDAAQEHLGNLELMTNQLKLQGLTDKQIEQRKLEAANNLVKAGEKAIEAQEALSKSEEESAEKRDVWMAKIGNFFSAGAGVATYQISVIEKPIDEVLAKLQKDQKRLESAAAGHQLAINAIDESEKNAASQKQSDSDDKRIAANQKTNDKLKADNEKAADEQAKLDKEKADIAAKLLKDAVEIDTDAARRLRVIETDARILKFQDLKEKYEAERKLLKEQGMSTFALTKTFAAEAIADKKAERIEDLKTEQDFQDKKAAIAEKAAQDKKEKDAIDAARNQSIQNNAVASANAFSMLIGEVGNKNIKVQKAQALIQVGIDTALAISSLVRYSNGNLANLFTGGMAGIMQFTAGMLQIGANMARAVNILGSSNSVSLPPNAPLNNATSTGNNLQNNQQDNRVYVLETDITTGQSKSRNLAGIGIVR